MGQATRIRHQFGGYSLKHRLLAIALMSTLMPILLLLYIRHDIMRNPSNGTFPTNELHAVDGIIIGGAVLAIAGLIFMHSVTSRLVSLIRSLRYGIRFGQHTYHDDLEMARVEVDKLRDQFDHQKSEIDNLKRQNQALEHEFEKVSDSQGVAKPVPRVNGRWDERGWEAYLTQEVERSRRYHKQFSILFIKIDGMRDTIHELPYAERSTFKRMVMNRVASYLRLSDLITGDAFQHMVVLLPETDARGGSRAARRIWASFAEEIFMPWKAHQGISFSSHIGCATYPQDAPDAPTLIERARESLTRAASSRAEPNVAVYNRGEIILTLPSNESIDNFHV
jgi:diguanylate cyclase (GGDEF)-like protein